MDTVTDLKSKEIKRATLNELVDYVSTNRGVLVEPAYPEITDMVRTHTHMHGNNKPLGCLTPFFTCKDSSLKRLLQSSEVSHTVNVCNTVILEY